jgi:hypothetical protein
VARALLGVVQLGEALAVVRERGGELVGVLPGLGIALHSLSSSAGSER